VRLHFKCPAPHALALKVPAWSYALSEFALKVCGSVYTHTESFKREAHCKCKFCTVCAMGE